MLMAVRAELGAEIDIPDPNLRAAIAEAIGVSPNTPISRGQLKKLLAFSVTKHGGISDLTGLEGATRTMRRLKSGDGNREYIESD